MRQMPDESLLGKIHSLNKLTFYFENQILFVIILYILFPIMWKSSAELMKIIKY